ncbi:hypothetical protein F5880DRAFT_1614629 [Lentinula raphanica]|nr:hypothetical protein F5880DRAFT_1614629 [Lentinula raphanica]
MPSRSPSSTLFLLFYFHYAPASSLSSAHLKYNTQLQNTLLRRLTRYMPLTLCTPNLPTRLTQFQQDPSIPLLGRLLRVSPLDLILYLLMPNGHGHGQSWSKREFRRPSILTNVLRLILKTRTELKGEQDEGRQQTLDALHSLQHLSPPRTWFHCGPASMTG